jgi:3-mercaptopyruvate sulfurtransferase SseA
MNEATSARVALELRKAGWPRSYALTGGFEAWQKAGLEVERKAS